VSDLERVKVYEQFQQDVKDHKMQIQLDQAVFRHLRFAKPGTNSYSFSITTWPGHLAISGDMGCYVFSRLLDMFEFHRREAAYKPGCMDRHYWAEKIQAHDKHSAPQEFSWEVFAESVREHLKNFVEGEGLDTHPDDDLVREVDSAIRTAECDGEYPAFEELGRIRAGDPRKFVFQDLSDIPCRDFSFRFTWCCCAIEWAIELYDRYQAAIGINNDRSVP